MFEVLFTPYVMTTYVCLYNKSVHHIKQIKPRDSNGFWIGRMVLFSDTFVTF